MNEYNTGLRCQIGPALEGESGDHSTALVGLSDVVQIINLQTALVTKSMQMIYAYEYL